MTKIRAHSSHGALKLGGGSHLFVWYVVFLQQVVNLKIVLKSLGMGL